MPGLISNGLICQRGFLGWTFNLSKMRTFTRMLPARSAFNMKFEQKQLEIRSASDLDLNKVLEPVSRCNAILFSSTKTLNRGVKLYYEHK